MFTEIVRSAITAQDRPNDWGSRLEIDDTAAAALTQARGRPVKIILPKPATDYQQQIAQTLRSLLRPASGGKGTTIVIGPPAFNEPAMPTLCREDTLRLKCEAGLAGLVTHSQDAAVVHVAGLSDFGDALLIDWLRHSAELRGFF